MKIDLNDKKVWQQAAGDSDRNYVNICLDWDVILNGPGDYGEWPDCIEELENDNWSSKKITDLKRFCEDISDGDIVVLRMNTNEIYGVGQVVGGYEWRDIFSDVDGWNIQHVRRVKWLWKNKRKPKKFDTYTLKFGDTTQELTSEEVENWIKQIDVPEEKMKSSLTKLPETQGKKIERKEISEYLFDHGVSSQIINELNDEIDELIRIANWYNRQSNPSESETVTYLTIPLLRALGWTPQRMAIEWNKIDIALFNELPRNDKYLSTVVEAKKKSNSCLTAWSQAQRYAEEKDRDTCKRLIVTDGLRYGIYLKENNDFKNSPEAYLNLTQLRDDYPIYKCKGAKEALYIMSPYWKK